MRNITKSLALSALLVVSLVSFHPIPPIASQVTWGKVGESTIEPTTNGMTTVNAVAGLPLKAIKIKVLKGGVNLHKCEIWFENGERKLVELRNEVSAGNESREIHMTDNNEPVSKVVFWYDTRNYGNQRTAVELWGKRFA